MRTILKAFLCTTLLCILVSCTDESPVESPQNTEGTIYFFTNLTNPVTRELEHHFCKMDGDGSNRTLISQMPTFGFWPYEVQYSANMTRLMYGEYNIMRIDGSDRRYMTSAWAEESHQAVSPDGERFFQARQSWCYVWDGANDWKKRRINGAGGYSHSWSYDSKHLILNSNGSIISWDVDSTESVKTIYSYNSDSTAGRAGRVYASPYYDKILFERYGSTSADAQLCIMNGDGSELRPILRYSALEYQPRLANWSRDGQSALLYWYSNSNNTEVGSLDLTTGQMQQILRSPDIYARTLEFSPDALKIVYLKYIRNQDTAQNGQMVLKTINVDGSDEKTLTPEGYNDAAPGWFP